MAKRPIYIETPKHAYLYGRVIAALHDKIGTQAEFNWHKRNRGEGDIARAGVLNVHASMRFEEAFDKLLNEL